MTKKKKEPDYEVEMRMEDSVIRTGDPSEAITRKVLKPKTVKTRNRTRTDTKNNTRA